MQGRVTPYGARKGNRNYSQQSGGPGAQRCNVALTMTRVISHTPPTYKPLSLSLLLVMLCHAVTVTDELGLSGGQA